MPGSRGHGNVQKHRSFPDLAWEEQNLCSCGVMQLGGRALPLQDPASWEFPSSLCSHQRCWWGYLPLGTKVKMRKHLETRFHGRTKCLCDIEEGQQGSARHHPVQNQPVPLQMSPWGDAGLFCLCFLFSLFSFKLNLAFSSCTRMIFACTNIWRKRAVSYWRGV